MWFLITFVFIGFVSGLIARALVSGPSPKGLIRTTGLGIIGSFVGGFLGYVLFGHDLGEGALQVSGLLGSVLGAILVLLIYRRTRR
ncbi:MAG: GlsB/YeaQ/YmgE family stress response membrane protein [Acidimicrobiales bacterium]